MPDMLQRIENDFKFHPATDKTGSEHQRVRDRCLDLARFIVEFVPNGREQSLALTSLEETMMWCNAGIARNS